MTELIVTSPFSGETLKTLSMNTADQANEMLITAFNLHTERKLWPALFSRIEILEKTAALMTERKRELIELAVKEGGKPWKDTEIEMDRAISGVKLAIESATHVLKGDQVLMGQTKASAGRIAFSVREPIGVVFAISAFNHPINLIIHQVIPAVITGCPVLIKPSILTPLSCLAIVNILKEAGLPNGWVQVLLCDNPLAEKIVTDSRVSYLSFIGSAKVGWYLRSKVAAGTRVALEHGGAAPVIIAEDADLDHAIPLLAKGGFYHAGQVCVSVQRVFVHNSLMQAVAEKLSKLADAQVVGDSLFPETDVGPLITAEEVKRVASWVDQAVEEGAKLKAGGKKLAHNCYAPTVLLDPSPEVMLSKYEIFGPVISLYSFCDRFDAIERANSLPLAFQAAVFTKNIDVMLDTAHRLDATTVMVNDHTAFRVDWMPFGGRKKSGLSVGGVSYTMHDMTQEKLIVINSPVLMPST